jgi:hypothetical protein
MKNLSDFTIFLHGPSGAGKGELQRKLTAEYEKEGYLVQYISSGDLYREAFSKPEIAEAMKRGIFFDTLGAIIPGLKERYQVFIESWLRTSGKTVLLLDGLVRRGEFTNEQDVLIPSQIEQVAEAFCEVRKSYSVFGNEDTNDVIKEIENADHVLIDINPKDAELQMRLRANKEMIAVKQQLDEIVGTGNFPFESVATMYLLVAELQSIINAEIKSEEEFELLSAITKQLRTDIATVLGKEIRGSFAAFFKELGITTQLRDDDISPVARRKRISNYVSVHETNLETSYIPGFAAQALVEGLGYQFSSEGNFSTLRDNCLVIQNGKSKGIELEQFQRNCESVSSGLYTETERARELAFFDPELVRRGKEK